MKVVSSKAIHLENAEEASQLWEILDEWKEQELNEPEKFQNPKNIDFAEELLSALVAYGDY